MGFKNATPIQQQAIPLILAKKDLIACAQTGTGKTGAFLLPIMNQLTAKHDRHNEVLILTPTRELAQQIDNLFEKMPESSRGGIATAIKRAGSDTVELQRILTKMQNALK